MLRRVLRLFVWCQSRESAGQLLHLLQLTTYSNKWLMCDAGGDGCMSWQTYKEGMMTVHPEQYPDSL